MKKTFLLLPVFAASLLMVSCGGEEEKEEAEDSTEQAPVKEEEKKEVKKQIEVSKEDGELKVTITTTTNGVEDVEVLTGQEAQDFIDNEKIDDSKPGEKSKKVEVKIEIDAEDKDKYAWIHDIDFENLGEEEIESELKSKLDKGVELGIDIKIKKDGENSETREINISVKE